MCENTKRTPKGIEDKEQPGAAYQMHLIIYTLATVCTSIKRKILAVNTHFENSGECKCNDKEKRNKNLMETIVAS